MDIPITIVYVEDNEIDIVKFEKLISQFPDLKLLQTFREAPKALEFCAIEKPDLAIIDIRLEGNSGMWLAQEFAKLTVPFAFLSGHDDYAIQAFDAFAIHYLMKPVTASKIRELITRFKKLKQLYMEDDVNIEEKNTSENFPRRIYVNTQKQILILQLEEVVYVEANGSYTTFYMKDGKSIISGRNLKKYAEQLLTNPDFVKIHRSYIINQSHLQSINKKRLEMTFQFKNAMQIKVATFRKDEWMDKFF